MSSSESDDETFDAQPTAQPLKQSQKVPSRNEQYQNLVNAKNKFSEMLKNKIKQSERTSITLNDDYEFNPVASSTQINTPDELKREKKKQKKAGTPFKLTNLLHTDDSTIKKKKRHFKENEIINISSTIISSNSNSESDEDSLKPGQSSKKKNADSSEESKSESSSGSTSDGTSNRVSQIQNKHIKSSKLENSPRHSHAKRKSSASSDESSENDKSNLQSAFSSKQKKQVVQKSSSGSQSDSQEEENSKYKITENSRFNMEQHSKSNLQQEPSSESSESDSKSNYQRHPSPNKINTFSGGKEAKVISSSQNKPNPLNKIQKRSNSSEESSSYSSSDEFLEHKIKPSKAENTPISRLKNYEEESSFQKISGANDFLRDIKSNEDIFLLQVPIKIDPQSLVGVNISLSEAIRIPQRKKYDSVPVSETPGNVALFCNSTDDRIRIVKPVRYIKIQRRLKKKTVAEVPETTDKSFSFPHNLKQRHPLFGSEFANKIQLEEHVKQKLEAAEHTRNIKIKKKEKKKKMQKEEDQKEEIFKLLNQSISSVAPTTSKSNEKLQFSEDSDNAREKRHKKKKKKSREVEEEKFIAKKKKKKKSKEYQLSEEESRSDGKKRKNVDLDSSNSSQQKSKNNSENDLLIKQLLSLENDSLYKKKKKKRKYQDE